MTDAPAISIVIPCFNCAATLRETIAGLQRQTWVDFEIIAVDDSSSDATPALLQELAAAEPRLRVIRQANAGCGAARNAGIRQARGRFVGLIDADDVWQPGYLAAHMQRFADDPELGVSFTRIHFIHHDGTATGETTRPKLDGIGPQDLLEGNPAGCAMMVARRQVFDDVGLFNDRLRRAEDQEWLFRVTLSRWRIRGIDAPLADYRNSPAGLSADLEAQFGAYLDLLGHVVTLAPDIVARGRRRAIGHMLMFCARRAVRLGQEKHVVRHYLFRALATAPELLALKPRAMAGLLMASLAPSGAALLQRKLRLRRA